MGPSIITAPDLIQRLFECAGTRMEDYLDLVKLDPFYRIYFHDGTHLDYTDDGEQMKQQMAQFSAADAENYDPFMAHTCQLYDAVITDGLGATAFDLPTMLAFLPRALRLRALMPAYDFVKRYFEDPAAPFHFLVSSAVHRWKPVPRTCCLPDDPVPRKNWRGLVLQRRYV